MDLIILPPPPSANDPKFNQKVVDWMASVKSAVEQASRVNDTPVAQQFQVGAFTTNTSISNAATLADVSNFVASLVTEMTSKGLITPVASRTNG